MSAEMVTIIVAALGALDIATLLIFFVNRHDSKKNIEGRLQTLEKDTLRTQLLMLMLLKPDSKHEIMTIGQHYFSKKSAGGIEGNWYMTDMFNHWLQECGDSAPEWFDSGS